MGYQVTQCWVPASGIKQLGELYGHIRKHQQRLWYVPPPLPSNLQLQSPNASPHHRKSFPQLFHSVQALTRFNGCCTAFVTTVVYPHTVKLVSRLCDAATTDAAVTPHESSFFLQFTANATTRHVSFVPYVTTHGYGYDGVQPTTALVSSSSGTVRRRPIPDDRRSLTRI